MLSLIMNYTVLK